MDIEELLRKKTYPGRGIIVGLSPQARAVSAYFIMGRSENSRNRVFTINDETLTVEAFDPTQVKDPHLIHYTALQRSADSLMLSNGDHGDCILSSLKEGESLQHALGSCSYEPDEPHYTARISALVSLKEPVAYELAILKKGRSGCERRFFKYSDPTPGCGHLIHTYKDDGNPLPPFTGCPREVTIGEDIDAFSQKIWGALNKENRIALYVRYTDLSDGKLEERLFNKHTR